MELRKTSCYRFSRNVISQFDKFERLRDTRSTIAKDRTSEKIQRTVRDSTWQTIKRQHPTRCLRTIPFFLVNLYEPPLPMQPFVRNLRNVAENRKKEKLSAAVTDSPFGRYDSCDRNFG